MAEKITTEEHEAYQRIHASDDFAKLKKSYLGFVFPMTAAFMIWYLMYVFACMWAGDFMNQKVYGNINVALVWGLLQFVSTFAIALMYSRHSDKVLDPLSDKLKHEFDEEFNK